MQQLKQFSLLLLLLLGTLGLRAQGGNVVVSEVKLYDMGNGTGILAVRVSGSGAYAITGGSFTASGDRIPGGTAGGGIGSNSRVSPTAPTPGNGNGSGNTNPNGNTPVILTGIVPLGPSTGQGPDFVDIQLSVTGDGRVFWHWSFPVTTTNP